MTVLDIVLTCGIVVAIVAAGIFVYKNNVRHVGCCGSCKGCKNACGQKKYE